MRIAILSCFYPFRGGIAQFNADLLTELGKGNEVRAFNFSRQYPSFLFPGKTQLVGPGDAALKVDSEAILDTANPFTWGKTARAIRKWQPDVLVMRYWMSYFAPSLGSVSRRLHKDCKRVAILDNVIPHERHFFDKPLTKYFLRSLDGGITLCKEVSNDLRALRDDLPSAVLPHPVYTHFGEKVPRREAEKKLGLLPDKRNILFFGLIREYKGLDILLEAFKHLDRNYQLIIAGEPYGSFDRYERLIEECNAPERIHVFPDYIADSEVKYYFSAADVTVLPYRSATQSGISSISNNFEVPMIVTDVGGLRETIGNRGTGIVCNESTPGCISAEIKRFFAEPLLRNAFVANIKKEGERLGWAKFTDDLIDFVNTLDK